MGSVFTVGDTMIRKHQSPTIPDGLTPRARKVARDVVKLLKKEGWSGKVLDPFWTPQRYYEATNKTHQKNHELFCMVLILDDCLVDWLTPLFDSIAEICKKHSCYLEMRNSYSAYVGVHGL